MDLIGPRRGVDMSLVHDVRSEGASENAMLLLLAFHFYSCWLTTMETMMKLVIFFHCIWLSKAFYTTDPRIRKAVRSRQRSSYFPTSDRSLSEASTKTVRENKVSTHCASVAKAHSPYKNALIDCKVCHSRCRSGFIIANISISSIKK